MKTTSCAALFVLCAFLALLPVGANLASPAGQTGGVTIVPCDVEASFYGLPNGLNVRSGPGKTYKAIRNLNQKVEGMRVHITGASGEWVRIDRATEEGGDPDRTLFHGAGWVYAPLLAVSGMAITEGGTNLYQDTTKKSRVIIRVPGGDDATVRGCHGQWIYVEYNKKKRGWAAPNTMCANSLTTCV
jgi:SH3-like domain-containing protein